MSQSSRRDTWNAASGYDTADEALADAATSGGRYICWACGKEIHDAPHVKERRIGDRKSFGLYHPTCKAVSR